MYLVAPLKFQIRFLRTASTSHPSMKKQEERWNQYRQLPYIIFEDKKNHVIRCEWRHKCILSVQYLLNKLKNMY